MSHSHNTINLCENIDVELIDKFKDERLAFKGIITKCASVQKENSDDPIRPNTLERSDIKVKTEHDEIHIEETQILNMCHSENFSIKEECEELQTQSELLPVSLIDVKREVELECDPLEDPLLNIEEKHYKCIICPEVFSLSEELKIHQRRHAGEKTFKCDTCNRGFAEEYNLKVHMKIHVATNKKKEKSYKCNICHKEFCRSGNLKRHYKTSSACEKPYKCEICERGFALRSKLKYHMQIHLPSRKRAYMCNVCDKGFYTLYTLNDHYKIHGEKSYNCEICKKGFYKSTGLKIHLKTHRREKPYKCDVCSRGYSHEYTLKVHKETHVEKLPIVEDGLKCGICDKQFTKDDQLKAHKKEHMTNDLRNTIKKKLSQMLGS